MKSYFDLVSSIVSSIKHYRTNWLIVEGAEDFKYLSSMLEVPNLKILPVGGCGNVKVMYDFLYAPMSYKGEEEILNGKVLCLIDTDLEGPELEFSSETKNKKLRFRRLQIKNNRVEMVKNDDQLNNIISIEQCLDPETFYNSLIETAKYLNNNHVLSIFDEISLDTNARTSEILGDNSMIYFNGPSNKLKTIKTDLADFVFNNKELISCIIHAN